MLSLFACMMNRFIEPSSHQNYNNHNANHQGYDWTQAGPSTSIPNYEYFCEFCKESLDDDEDRKTRKTKCGHTFHLDCMNLYLPDRKRCPVCNTHIKWIDIDEKCAVCFDMFVDYSSTITPHCQHEMHRECVKQWMVTKSRCPICKKHLTFREDLSDYEEETDDNSYYDEEDSDTCSDDYSEEADFGESCFYCAEDLDGPLKQLRCGHTFHLRCMNVNLPIDKKCGICEIPVLNWVNTNDLCVQCCKSFKSKDNRFTCICEHEFHTSCVKKVRHRRCPICRCAVKEKVDVTCSICLESCTTDFTVTTCHHKFHYKCLSEWKAINSCCPICRKNI